ncbi:MAG: type II toxin-antitoxin system RelE/ParE family toxin [Spirochaetota bacterium]
MLRKVSWSNHAELDYQKILQYLHKNWGKNSAKKFAKTVNKTINLVTANPKMYPIYLPKLGIRKTVLVKQVSMYYIEIEVNHEVKILKLYNNSANPDSIKEELEKF